MPSDRDDADAVIPFDGPELEGSVPERFERVGGRVPDRIAVKRGNEVVTYAELNAAADRIAGALLARRGSAAEAVGVLLNRGVLLPAALLGILKAGKFFVPLDPSFPEARIAATLADAQAGVLITDRRNRGLGERLRGGSRVVLDVESTGAADGRGSRPTIAPSSLAGLLYTSGSTGEPKGVQLDHAALLHNAMLQGNITSITAADRVLLLAFGTANAVSTTLFALLSGAALFPFDVGNEGLAELARRLAAERISIAPTRARTRPTSTCTGGTSRPPAAS
jgi:non-ribosomal peptide synthetase component F